MSTELSESFLDGFSILVNDAVSKSSNDKTIECEVTRIVDSEKGIYTVQYTENKFTATSINGASYAIGDSVYVLIPQGNFSANKIILGLSRGAVLRSENQEIDYHNEISDNLLTDIADVELCTYHSEVKDVAFNDDFIGAILANYQHYALKCDVRTGIVDLSQRANGNYGIRISIPIVDESGVQSTINRTIDVNNMNGDVYNFEDYITQTLYFDFDGEKYDSTRHIKVSAFVTNFNQDEEITTPDIFIKNIELKAVEVLTDEDVAGYFLSIKSTDGFLFLRGKYDADKILTPNLKVDGASADVREYDCFWFREDASIDIDNEYYNSNGGRGWRCLNSREKIGEQEDGTAIYDFNTSIYSYVVKETDVISSAKYKCVLVNPSKSLHKVVTIANLNSDLVFSLTTPSGSTSFVRDVGVVNLIAKLHYPGSTENITFDYLFQRFNKDGEYIDNNFYSKVKWNEIDGENRLTQISFPVGNIDEVNTIKCEFVRRRIQDGEVITESIGISSITLTTGIEVYDYYLSILNEEILYKYDANGNSPLVADYDGPFQSKLEKLEPITVKMFKTSGDELDSSEYNYLNMTWAFPKNSMMELVGYELDDLDQDDDYYYVKGKNITSLSYSIKTFYDPTKVDNTILITAVFDNTELKAKATILFLKDGESGTNGSQYAAVVKYNINDDEGQPRWYAYGERDRNGIPQKIRLIYVQDTWKRYLSKLSVEEGSQYVDFGIPTFDVEVYKNGKLVNYDPENPAYDVTWNMLDAESTDPFFDLIKNTGTQGVLQVNGQWEDPETVSVNIIQAAITITESSDETTGEEYLFAYYPVDIVRLNSNQKFVPEIADGYDTVKFDSDGTVPKYNTNKKFRINVIDGRTDFFESSWDSSDTMIAEDDVLTNRLEEEYRPISQLVDGESKNYVKVNLTQTNENIAELNAEVAALVDEINNLNNQISYLENEKSYLYNFVNSFNYDSYINRLSNFSNYLKYRATYLDDLFGLISDLDNIEFLDPDKYDYTEKKATINEVITKILNAETAEDIEEYTSDVLDTTDVEDAYILSFMEDFNTNIGTATLDFTKLESILDLGSSEIMMYNSMIDSLNSLVEEMTELCSEHDQQPANETFISLRNQLETYITYFRDSTKNCYNINGIKDVLASIGTLLEPYEDYEYFVNNYNKKIDSLEEELEKKHEVLDQSDQSVFDVAIVIKPILFLLDRYGLAFINGWDGNKIYTGNDDEFLLAPQIGAGKKDDHGLFTGIVMGVKVAGTDREEIGLIGKHQGQDSIFLDAETGNAIFGKAGEGQIRMIPDGVSTIAGWEIDEFSLGKTYGDTSVYLYSNYDEEEDAIYPPKPDGTGDFTTPKYIAFQAMTDDENSEEDLTTYITYDGYLYSNQAYIEGNIHADAGYIADWKIVGNGIAAEEGSDAFIRAGKTSADDENEGFYLSSTAFSIGDDSTYLKYNENGLSIVGHIEADTGSIGPFNVNEDYIWTAYEGSINFVLGEEGICLGGVGKFYLGENYVGSEAEIEDWPYQGGTIIHSNGGIQTDYLTIMHNGEYHHTLPNPDAIGIYMDLTQGVYPSKSDLGSGIYPLQLRLIGCTTENEIETGAYIGLWSEGRLIIGENDYGRKSEDDPTYYAFKASIDGGLYVNKYIYCSFKESAIYRLDTKEVDGTLYVVAKEDGQVEATAGGDPNDPGGNSGGNVFSSADIITFDTSVLGGDSE